jgi:hypothetical protein
LLLVAVAAHSQSRVDSFYTPYDSIQDLDRQRAERTWNRQMEAINEQLMESNRQNDSLVGEVNFLNRRVGTLEGENRQLDDALRNFQLELEQQNRESDQYRRKLRTILWITGTLLFLLLIGSFFYLLQYSLRTRRLLRSVQARLRRLRKTVRVQRDELRNIPQLKKKRIRKIAGREINSRLKKLKFRKKKK